MKTKQLLFLMIFVIMPTGFLSAEESTIVRGAGTIYDRNTCARESTNGVIEWLLEKSMGKFKAAQLGCCAVTVERACGETLSSMPSNPRGTVYNNCMRAGVPTAICYDAACQAWANDCRRFSAEQIHEALTEHNRRQNEASNNNEEND